MEVEQPFKEEPLPFSKPKQEALLGYALVNDRFFDQIKLQVKANWFVDPRCTQVYAALVAESAFIGRKMKPWELKECHSFMHKADNATRALLCSAIDRFIAQTDQFGLDTITPELTDWLKARVYMEQVYKSRDLFNASRNAQDSPTARARRNEAYQILNEMGREINNISFESNGEVTFEDIPQDLKIYEEEYKEAMTFGSTVLDKQLLPEANGAGSLLPGDMTIVMGPQNAGKTSCMLTTLAANLIVGKDCMLVPHEGRVNDIKLKLIQSIMGLTKRELFYYAQDQANRPKFKMVEELLNEHLIYSPMIKAGLNVEEVGNNIRRGIDRFAAKRQGRRISLVVNDYLARCTSIQNGRGQFQKRERDQVVYEYGASLAGECHFHLLTAIQVNRTGNEINRGIKKGVEERLLVPEDVSESYGTMMVATNVISINRSPHAQLRNRVTFLICKSRSSETHIAVACGSDYSRCITHSDKFGATWYRGLSPMEERIDELMAQYNNAAIPELLVLTPGA